MRLTPKGHEILIRGYLKELGESVEIYWEPRNKGDEWYVGLASPSPGEELPLHGHFSHLLDGLSWLVDAKRTMKKKKKNEMMDKAAAIEFGPDS